jgi:hypothetical protein
MEQKIPEKKIGRVVSVNMTHDFMKTLQYFEFLITRDPNFPEPKNNRKESKASLVIRKLIGNYVKGNWDYIISNKKEFIKWKDTNYYSDGRKIVFSKKKKSKTKHERRSKKYEQEDINDDYEEDPDVTEALKKSEEEE